MQPQQTQALLQCHALDHMDFVSMPGTCKCSRSCSFIKCQAVLQLHAFNLPPSCNPCEREALLQCHAFHQLNPGRSTKGSQFLLWHNILSSRQEASHCHTDRPSHSQDHAFTSHEGIAAMPHIVPIQHLNSQMSLCYCAIHHCNLCKLFLSF